MHYVKYDEEHSRGFDKLSDLATYYFTSSLCSAASCSLTRHSSMNLLLPIPITADFCLARLQANKFKSHSGNMYNGSVFFCLLAQNICVA